LLKSDETRVLDDDDDEEEEDDDDDDDDDYDQNPTSPAAELYIHDRFAPPPVNTR
jgi:hypothetical protein